MKTELTKREAFAKAAMEGLIAAVGYPAKPDFKVIAADAVRLADALIEALK